MGEEADYQLEQEELNMLTFGDHDHEMHEFPYGFHRHITKPQLAELARQAERDGNIHEQAMRGLTLEQVLARSKRDNT